MDSLFTNNFVIVYKDLYDNKNTYIAYSPTNNLASLWYESIEDLIKNTPIDDTYTAKCSDFDYHELHEYRLNGKLITYDEVIEHYPEYLI